MDATRLQEAINDANADGGGLVGISPGEMVKLGTAAQIVPKSNVRVCGSGMGVTVLKMDDSVGSNYGIHWDGSEQGALLENWSFENLTFEGGWIVSSAQSENLPPLRIEGFTNGRLINVESRYSRQYGVVAREGDRLDVEGCWVHHCVRDGINAWNTYRVIVGRTRGEDLQDDFISVHVDDSVGYACQEVLIEHCQWQKSLGITSLGAKNISIRHNQAKLIGSRAIYVGVSIDPSTGQGNTPPLSIDISHNQIQDVYQLPSYSSPAGVGQRKRYIEFKSNTKQPGTGNNAAPGENDTIDGSFVEWYGSSYVVNTDDTSVASPGGYWVRITNNDCIRTRESVTNYSDWGFGTLFSGKYDSGYYDGAITDAKMNVYGLVMQGAMKNVLVARNRFSTGDYSVFAEVGQNSGSTPSQYPVDLQWQNVVFDDNDFQNFGDYGFFWEGTVNPTTQHIIFRGNRFNGDPEHIHSNRGSGGTWLAASPPTGLYLGQVGGCIIEGNHFRNVQRAVSAFGANVYNHVFGNYLYCQPAADGFSVSNKGIGFVPEAGDAYRFIVEGSDPTSATYGKVQQETLFENTAMPSAGTYVKGHFVRNTSTTVTDRNILLGWRRMVTGTSHALNTDWYAVYGKTYQNTVQALTAAGAITPDASNTTLANSSGSTYAVTLAAPGASTASQVKVIRMTSGSGVNTVTLALTNVVGGSAATTATFDAAGETLILISTGAAWMVIKEHGVTLT